MGSQKGYFVYFAALAVNFFAISAGSGYSWTSPVLPKLYGQSENPFKEPISTLDESWITSLISLGAALGPFAAGFASERIGKKKTLLIFSFPSIICHLIIAFANQVHFYLLARFLVGLSAGCVFSVMPSFLAEIAEDTNRGLLGCFLGSSLAFGVLWSYLIGPFVNIQVFSFINLIPLVLFIVLFGFFIPETPYYLIYTNQQELAEESLAKYRSKSKKYCQKELDSIRRTIEADKTSQNSLFEIIKSKAILKGLMLSCGLMVCQQGSGITAVLSYMQTIFEATGTSIPSDYSSIFIGLIQLIVNIITSQLVDRLGRRPLLIISGVGCSLCLTILGAFFYLKNNGFDTERIFWLPIASLLSYTIAYNLGLGCLPLTVMSELFPSNAKSFASTITIGFGLSLAFIITVIFPNLAILLGMSTLFFIFSCLSLLGAFFIVHFVPETKGRSFAEIQEILRGSNYKS